MTLFLFILIFIRQCDICLASYLTDTSGSSSARIEPTTPFNRTVVKQRRSLLSVAPAAPVLVPNTSLCALAVGDWCKHFVSQPLLPFKAAPRGDTSCPNNCSQVGNCDYDTGRCYCPVGYGGDDCSAPRKRPCFRMGPDKLDSGWTQEPQEGSVTRCQGYCDDNYAHCYCAPGTKFGHIPAPEGSPYGTPPVQAGRPMYWCQVTTTKSSEPVKWAYSFPDRPNYEQAYGEQGWCNADQPPHGSRCTCRTEGHIGEFCEVPIEHLCPNQCTARGLCVYGFCKCHDGWYGNDCSRQRRGLAPQPDDIASGHKPYLSQAVTPVAAARDVGAASAMRKRPFIYVYDTGSEYMSDLLQWRGFKDHCQYRHFGAQNETYLAFYSYSMEPVIHELFLTSPHRTFDPEEADYFFVPHYGTCFFDFYYSNRIPMWPQDVHGSRPMGTANMLVAAQKWIADKYPYFNRSGGADHIWLMAHDEGACYSPSHIWPGVILTPWGRMDMPHTHQSAYVADHYSSEVLGPGQEHGWLKYTSRAHPCYDPVKDLVLPVFKDPHHYAQSIYLGGQQPARDVLFFFRGDMGEGKQQDVYGCRYSRCIRQRLLNLSVEQEWSKHSVLYGRHIDGDYSQLLLRSVFCLVIPGDGWSARFPDAMLHGCIPVIIQDNTHAPYENILDYSKFSLRHPESALATLFETLRSVSAERVKEMQDNVHRVWQRFRYVGLSSVDAAVRQHVSPPRVGATPHAGAEFALSHQEDAFDTILQFLHMRMPFTRGPKRSAQAAGPAAADASAGPAQSSSSLPSLAAAAAAIVALPETEEATEQPAPGRRVSDENGGQERHQDVAVALLEEAAQAAVAAVQAGGTSVTKVNSKASKIVAKAADATAAAAAASASAVAAGAAAATAVVVSAPAPTDASGKAATHQPPADPHFAHEDDAAALLESASKLAVVAAVNGSAMFAQAKAAQAKFEREFGANMATKEAGQEAVKLAEAAAQQKAEDKQKSAKAEDAKKAAQAAAQQKAEEEQKAAKAEDAKKAAQAAAQQKTAEEQNAAKADEAKKAAESTAQQKAEEERRLVAQQKAEEQQKLVAQTEERGKAAVAEREAAAARQKEAESAAAAHEAEEEARKAADARAAAAAALRISAEVFQQPQRQADAERGVDQSSGAAGAIPTGKVGELVKLGNPGAGAGERVAGGSAERGSSKGPAVIATAMEDVFLSNSLTKDQLFYSVIYTLSLLVALLLVMLLLCVRFPWLVTMFMHLETGGRGQARGATSGTSGASRAKRR